MAMKQKINPLTGNFDMVSDGDSGTIKQKFNPLTGNFDMVGEGEVKMKLNPLTSNFDMVSEGGGGGGWQPGENTIAYYQVNDSDTSSNVYDNYGNNDATRYGTASYETLPSGKRVINFTGSNGLYCGNKVIPSQPYTINLWLYQNGSQSPDNTVISNQNDDGNYGNILAYYDATTLIDFYGGGDWNWYSYSTDNGVALSTGTRHNVVVVVNGNTIQFYVDSVLIKTNTYAVAPDFTNSTDLSIGFLRSNGQGSSNFRFFNGKLSELIFESKGRAVQEITDHYNQTKDNYISQNVTVTITTGDYNKGLIQDSNGNTAIEQYAQVPDGSSIDYENGKITLSSGRYLAVPYDGYRFQAWIPQILTATEDANIYAYWQNCMRINGPDWMSNTPESSCPVNTDGVGPITVHGNFSSFEVRVANISGDPNNPESPLVYYMNGSQIPFDYDPISDEMYIRYGTNFSDSIGIELASGQGTTTFDVIYQFADSGDVINDQWTLRESTTVQIDLISTDSSRGTITDENGNTNVHWEIAVDEGSSIAYDGYDGITLYEGGVQKTYLSERMAGYSFLMIDPQPSTASGNTSIFYYWQYAYETLYFNQNGDELSSLKKLDARQRQIDAYDHITIYEGYAENLQFRLPGASTDPVSIDVSIFNNGQTLTVNPIYDPDIGAFVFDTGTVGIDDTITIQILPGYSDVEFNVLFETPDHDIYDNDTWTIHALT